MEKNHSEGLSMFWFGSTLGTTAFALKAVFFAIQGRLSDAWPLLLLALGLSIIALVLEGKLRLPSITKRKSLQEEDCRATYAKGSEVSKRQF